MVVYGGARSFRQGGDLGLDLGAIGLGRCISAGIENDRNLYRSILMTLGARDSRKGFEGYRRD